jgi:hypothetical protein
MRLLFVQVLDLSQRRELGHVTAYILLPGPCDRLYIATWTKWLPTYCYLGHLTAYILLPGTCDRLCIATCTMWPSTYEYCYLVHVTAYILLPVTLDHLHIATWSMWPHIYCYLYHMTAYILLPGPCDRLWTATQFPKEHYPFRVSRLRQFVLVIKTGRYIKWLWRRTKLGWQSNFKMDFKYKERKIVEWIRVV